MTEKKRRQGQPGVKKIKEICPECGEYLKTAWMLENRKYKRVGLCCPNPACGHIIKDYVELKDDEEETETINEMEND